ncbi:type II toxin-antitoxin system RelE/ParE family toxin [Jiella sp. M17.18]|uniref:type II toxin-antitoxin system RelE/ParE family toxin n=1 Tax=Jiella sp. M17.18 TaxID=3234247 RepID=UPI0034DFEB29
MRVVFTPRAGRHIQSLHAYISAETSEAGADSYTDRILLFCRSLATFPLRGSCRDDILPGLRVVGFKRRVSIAFTVHQDVVVIEGVFYGGRNFERDLE